MNQDWLAECRRRLVINEGERNVVYRDTMGIPTIGIGFNLLRPDAPSIIKAIGADYDAVLNGQTLTAAQVEALFEYSFAPIIDEARHSLQPTHFDNWLSPARQFVLCDLVFNLGETGWDAFGGTRSLIDNACHEKATGNESFAGSLFGAAADHLAVSAWYGQVGDRARRDCAMLRSSGWVGAAGDGSS